MIGHKSSRQKFRKPWKNRNEENKMGRNITVIQFHEVSFKMMFSAEFSHYDNFVFSPDLYDFLFAQTLEHIEWQFWNSDLSFQ